MRITIPKWLADLTERAGWTAFQTFLGVMAASDVFDVATVELAAMAAVAAGLAVVKFAVTDFLRSGRRSSNLWVDVAERTGATFLEVFLAAVIVNPGDAATYKYAYVAALAAAVAVVKGTVARRFGKPTAATLPMTLDPTPWPWEGSEGPPVG